MTPKPSTVAAFGGSATAVGFGATVHPDNVTLVFGFTLTQWQVIGIVGGILVGLAGVGVQALFQYFRWRKEQRYDYSRRDPP